MTQEAPHILVVDDDPVFRRFAARALKLGGYHCTTSDGLQDALTRLEQDRFDMLVVDLRMEGGSGLDLLRALPERHRLVPAMIVTAMPDLDTAIEALRMSVVDYVCKPVTDLAARCRGGLERSRARQALMQTAAALEEWSRWIERATRQVQRLRDGLVAPTLLQEEPEPLIGASPLPLERLSSREYEVVALLSVGLSNKDLAERLDISLHTVKNHIKAIFRKLEVGSRLELVSRLQRGRSVPA